MASLTDRVAALEKIVTANMISLIDPLNPDVKITIKFNDGTFSINKVTTVTNVLEEVVPLSVIEEE